MRLGYERVEQPDTSLVVPDKQFCQQFTRTNFLIPKLRGRFFFFDEANISWCPQTGRIYRIVGEEYKVNTPGRNYTKYILGSLEYPY